MAPVIGITADVDLQISEPPPIRAYYFLDATLVAAVQRAGGIPVILPHLSEQMDSYLGRIDGLVISGDSYRFTDAKLFRDLDTRLPDAEVPAFKLQRTRFELQAAKYTLEHDIPTLGICAGYQVMNVAAGGNVLVSLADQLPSSIEHRQTESLNIATHDVDVQPETRLRDIVGADQIRINSLHSQGIRIADSATASAIAPDGLVEAFEVSDSRFFVGVQWHPEFSASDADDKILRSFVRACKEDTRTSAQLLRSGNATRRSESAA